MKPIHINPDCSLIIVHPAYPKMHLLLTHFVLEPNAAYVRFNGEQLDVNDLFQQIESEISDLRHISNLVLDECDRALPDALKTVLSTLSKQLDQTRIVVFSRNSQLDWVYDGFQPHFQIVPKAFLSTTTADMPISHLEVFAMGSGRVFLNGREILNWGGTSRLHLFFFMIDSQKASLRKIIQTLWNNTPRQNAINLFHVTKKSIHEVLGFQLIEYIGGYYQITPKIHIHYDVQQINELIEKGIETHHKNHLLEARKMCHHDFLSGVQHQWIDKRRNELQARNLECIENLAHIAYQCGDIDEALHLYYQVWSTNRLREDIALEVMRIYLHKNQPDKALEVFWQTKDYIQDSLGIVPDSPLLHLGEIAQKRSLKAHISNKTDNKTVS